MAALGLACGGEERPLSAQTGREEWRRVPPPSNNGRVRLLIGLGCAVALLAPTPALAKGPDRASICGASGCVTVANVEEVNVLALWTAGFEVRNEPPAAPFFTVELTTTRGAVAKWSYVYVPSARALKIIRADFSGGISGVQPMNEWVSASTEVLAAYETATSAMPPFPASAGWIVSTPDERDVTWLIVALMSAAAALVALLFLRRIVTRRGARLANG